MNQPAPCPVCGCPDRRSLRIKEVAHAMDCSHRTVRRLITRGEIVAVRSGGWRIDHKSVHRFIDRGGAPARSA